MLKQEHLKILRFLISGGAAATTEYVVFVLLNYAKCPVLLSNTLSFLCGLVVSFSLNKMWVFSAKGNASRQFGLYFALATVNLGISNSLVWILTRGEWVPVLIAKIVVMITIAAWNYVFFSRMIFKERHLDA